MTLVTVATLTLLVGICAKGDYVLTPGQLLLVYFIYTAIAMLVLMMVP